MDQLPEPQCLTERLPKPLSAFQKQRILPINNKRKSEENDKDKRVLSLRFKEEIKNQREQPFRQEHSSLVSRTLKILKGKIVIPKETGNSKGLFESLLGNDKRDKSKRRLLNSNSVSPVLRFRNKQELGYGTRSLNFREKCYDKIKIVCEIEGEEKYGRFYKINQSIQEEIKASPMHLYHEADKRSMKELLKHVHQNNRNNEKKRQRIFNARTRPNCTFVDEESEIQSFEPW